MLSKKIVCDDVNGCPVLRVIVGTRVIAEEGPSNYQAPVVLKFDDAIYVAFSEYYAGTFTPLTPYRLTKVK